MSFVHCFKYKTLHDEVLTELPMQANYSFKLLMEYWERIALTEKDELASAARIILDNLKQKKIFKQKSIGVEDLIKNEEAIRDIVKPLFSPFLASNEIKALVIPFQPVFFHMTERLHKIIDDAGVDTPIGINVASLDDVYMHGCIFILNAYYKANINFIRAMYYNIPDANGITKAYRAYFNADFSTISLKKGYQPLTEKEVELLKDNLDDIQLLKKYIKPSSYLFEGFTIINMVDVTFEESLAKLKVELLKKDALITSEIVQNITKNLKSLLNIPHIKVGFVSYDDKEKCIKALGYGTWNSMLLQKKFKRKITDVFSDEVIQKLFVQKAAISNKDVESSTCGVCPIQMKSHELGSFIAKPLMYNGEVMGILELGSNDKNALNNVVVQQLDPVISLFETAVKRTLDEHESRLEAIIQEKCTAIHPTVTWRFFEAADSLLREKQINDTNEMEEILFPEVYPLFGQSDIMGSSTFRNDAIQADLTKQLTLASKILKKAIRKYNLPIYRELEFRVANIIRGFDLGISAGDEISVLDFLKTSIYPVFNHLENTDSGFKKEILEYQSKLHPELGIIVENRSKYEDSMQVINSAMANYLEEAQTKAQRMFPHYFEKYKTDGIEHNIYIGASLVKDREFDQVHLHNLRLWQLMTICEIERLVHNLKPQLHIPLEIRSLVLNHSNPITIKFRQDEKKFDVEGAYNIRYEIIKKRIDKALIKSSSERFTKVGMLSIVYAQDKEVEEYINYFKYLHSIGYVEDEIEQVEISDLQGIHGLKGIRVPIRYIDTEIDSLEDQLSKKIYKEKVGAN